MGVGALPTRANATHQPPDLPATVRKGVHVSPLAVAAHTGSCRAWAGRRAVTQPRPGRDRRGERADGEAPRLAYRLTSILCCCGCCSSLNCCEGLAVQLLQCSAVVWCGTGVLLRGSRCALVHRSCVAVRVAPASQPLNRVLAPSTDHNRFGPFAGQRAGGSVPLACGDGPASSINLGLLVVGGAAEQPR